jgi:hypothetical protein
MGIDKKKKKRELSCVRLHKEADSICNCLVAMIDLSDSHSLGHGMRG